MWHAWLTKNQVWTRSNFYRRFIIQKKWLFQHNSSTENIKCASFHCKTLLTYKFLSHRIVFHLNKCSRFNTSEALLTVFVFVGVQQLVNGPVPSKGHIWLPYLPLKGLQKYLKGAYYCSKAGGFKLFKQNYYFSYFC